MTLFDFLDYTGTIAFAISGALVAMRKRFDPFGVFIIAFVTAVGGGTLRDVLIGRNPVFWMANMEYIYAIMAGTILTIILRKRLRYLSKSLFLFDTIGLGLYTIVGTEIGMEYNFHPIICISLGTMSASFGGVIRDVLCNKIPLIFKKEVYATASIFGGIAFLVISNYTENQNVTYVVTSLIVIAIRLIAVRFKLELPSFYTTKQ